MDTRGRVYHRPSPHPQRPTSQYQQRTATFVNHRSNSLPTEQEELTSQSEKYYDRKSPATRSYNQKHDSSHHHKYQPQQKSSQSMLATISIYLMFMFFLLQNLTHMITIERQKSMITIRTILRDLAD